jgi:hypothetical protein
MKLPIIAAIILITSGTAVLRAQDPAPAPAGVAGVRVFNHTQEVGGDVVMLRDAAPTVEFVAAEASFAGKVVKGAPYSAQAITEANQTLSDGNRIHHESTSKVFRDSEGRTRREQTLGGIGAFGPGPQPHQMIFITDPVANVHYVLDPAEKTARKMPMPSMGMPPSLPGVEVSRQGLGQAMVMRRGRLSATKAAELSRNVKNDSLGSQMIEGVMAEGTSTMITIPAGQVGNERPIEIVSERWHSPDLQTVVMTKSSDPRMGTTTYKLTGINRAEPPHSLFEVPADYKVTEGGGFMFNKALP